MKMNISNLALKKFSDNNDSNSDFSSFLSIFKPAQVVSTKHAKDVSMAQDRVLKKSGFYELALDSFCCGSFGNDVDIVQFIGYGALSILEQNPINRIVVLTLAEEATRKWVELRTNDSKNADYAQKLQKILDDDYNAKSLLFRCCQLVSSHGGCCLFIDMGVDDDELELPLAITPETIRKGSFKGFRLIEPYLVYPAPYNAYNPLREDYFNPSHYYVQGGIKVHKSRLIRFISNETSNILKPAYNFFGVPLTQYLLKYIQGFERVDEATLHIIENFAMTGLKTNLSQILSSGECEDQGAEAIESLKRRIKIFNEQKKYKTLVVVDKEEEDFFKLDTNLSGLYDLTALKLQQVAFFAREPVPRLFGTPPQGFNATGESEQENWMDNIKNFSSNVLHKNYSEMRKIVELSVFGKYSEEIEEYWAPIMETNEVELSEVNNKKANTAQIYLNAGVITPSEVRATLVNDLNSGYNSIDGAIPSELENNIDNKKDNNTAVK